ALSLPSPGGRGSTPSASEATGWGEFACEGHHPTPLASLATLPLQGRVGTELVSRTEESRMNTVPKINPAAARAVPPPGMDPLEWETRVDLAAAYRLVDLFGMTDLHLNHISARVPGKEEHFLINPFGMLYEEITASSLIKIDLDGNIIANPNPEYTI